MTEYDCVIGLEVHAQLLTSTKIFCGCSTLTGMPPNTLTCPVCMGMPGVLPVLNQKVVEFGIMLGLALNCSINCRNEFARKNYFYPDLPKGYQITQFEHPLCEHGFVDIEREGRIKRIGITRIHMEEDAGKNIHDGSEPLSYIDFNRAGVPLLEIVSEPDIASADEATTYLRELRRILMYLGVCDGNMEQGSLRCDANVSVKPKGSESLGVRTELKNMNSFRNVGRAIEFEIRRHISILDAGGRVEQDTRLWDAAGNRTCSMRSKEESHDYRYFPEPDLAPLNIDGAWIEDIRNDLPELPLAKKKRFQEVYGLPLYDADVLTQSRDLAAYFEQCNRFFDSPKEVSNWIMTEVLRIINDTGVDIRAFPVSAEDLASLLSLVKGGTVSLSMAKDVFTEMVSTGKTPDLIVKEQGLQQLSDAEQIREAVKAIIADNPDEVKKYQAGKTALLGFFIGQLMKATKGKANPNLAQTITKEMLES